MTPLTLGKREKILVLTAAVLAVLFVVTQFVVSPLLDRRQRLQDSIASQGKNLAEILAMKSEYERIRRQADRTRAGLMHREQGFTLFSFLDGLAGRAGLKENISYMKPAVKENREGGFKSSTVEMKLKSITLKQLTEFLKLVESTNKSIFIKRLSITRKGKKQKRIDAVMLVETYVI